MSLSSTKPTMDWVILVFLSVDWKMAPLVCSWWIFWREEDMSTQFTTDLVPPCQLPKMGLSPEYLNVLFDIPFLVATWCLVLLNALPMVLHTFLLRLKLLLIDMIRFGTFLL